MSAPVFLDARCERGRPLLAFLYPPGSALPRPDTQVRFAGADVILAAIELDVVLCQMVADGRMSVNDARKYRNGRPAWGGV